jgi:hypothetical protein
LGDERQRGDDVSMLAGSPMSPAPWYPRRPSAGEEDA